MPFTMDLSFVSIRCSLIVYFFFFNDTATTEIYTLSLHDALPISVQAEGLSDGRHLLGPGVFARDQSGGVGGGQMGEDKEGDRKSTRLNSSHNPNSYARFCLKKKTKQGSYLSLQLLNVTAPPWSMR